MIALTRTHSKTALLCFAFLMAGVGCQQQAETPQEDSQASAAESTTDMAHEEHAHDDHEHSQDEHDHEGHEHGHEGHDHEGHEHGHEGHNHDEADMTTYTCQPEQVIKAHYDPEDSAQPATSAHLLIDGVEYDLTAMMLPQNNNTSAAYETDIGITNDAGMRWKLNADATKAVLSNKTLDGSVAEDAETVLFDCQRTDG